MSDGADVLRAIDQLRRDLSGYHGQLVAHNELQRHCERQKEQLASLQAAHKPIKDERDLYKRQADRFAAENAKLRELVRDLYMALWTCNQHTCKHGNDGCYTEDGNSGGRCTLHDRMYELGVGL